MSEPAPPPAPRPPGTFRIGSLAGADVLVSSSWFIVAGLIAFVVAPRIEAAQPGLGARKYVAGLAFAVILYLSVLLHEASHAYMARHYGYRVTSITLHFLGGVTAIDSEAKRPARSSGSPSSGRSRPSRSVGGASASGSSPPTGCCRWPSRGSPAPTCWSAC